MPPTVLVSKPEKQRDAVVLVDDRGARAQVGEGGERAGARALGTGAAAAAQQAVLGHDGQLQLGGEEALAQAGVGEQDARLCRRRPGRRGRRPGRGRG